MASYLLRRLILIPLTLLAILLVNFTIINLAPGDPSTISSGAMSGEGSREAGSEQEYGRDDQYLMFREHYGLTKPILFNLWPATSKEKVRTGLETLARRPEGMGARAHAEFRIRFGDRSRYTMPTLLEIAEDPAEDPEIRKMARRMFVRGGTQLGFTGPGLRPDQRAYNRQVSQANRELKQIKTPEEMRRWWETHHTAYNFEPTLAQRVTLFFTQTRLAQYLKRVLTLDFGTLRNDPNRSVVSEVGKRINISMTLAVLPMLLAFVFCQVIGFTMALFHNRWPDHLLNVTMLVLYAAPVFVIAPFLIEKVALPTALPNSGFHSAQEIYSSFTSWQRLKDISLHIFLPLAAIMYGTLAAQARLSRTAVLEVLRQPYVRTARAKGLPPMKILVKHVGRNAGITIITSLAASLGLVLSGTLIVETIFGIDGFGRFFYQAIVNRDYNVIMFSALAGATLALIGYLIADILYTVLDPRVSLE